MAIPNNVIYFNKTFYNPGTERVNAVCEEQFTRYLITDPADYHIAVERFELSMNSIAFCEYEAGDLIYKLRDHIGTGNDVDIAIDFGIAYSLQELIDNINKQLQYIQDVDESDRKAAPDEHFNGLNPATGYVRVHNLSGSQWCITDSGVVIIKWTTGNDSPPTLDAHGNPYGDGFPSGGGSIILSNKMQQIFGVAGTLVGQNWYYSPNSRYDCGPIVNHVYLRTTMPVKSDAIGQVFENILTDVSVSTPFNASYSLSEDAEIVGRGRSAAPPQRLIYQPSQRRYTNMSSNAPIMRIHVEAWITRMDGSTEVVKLGQGECFSVKLGFYKRK